MRLGGLDSGGVSRPNDGIKPFHLVAPLDNTTINKRPRWRGRNRPGDRVAASFLGRGKWMYCVSGGLDSGGVLRPGDGIKPFNLVAPLDNTTINEREKPEPKFLSVRESQG